MSNTRPMTIYDIASVVNVPYSQAFSQKNIKAGFAVSGTEPYNPNVFHDDEYLSSSVTDRVPEPAVAVQPVTTAASQLPSSSTSDTSSPVAQESRHNQHQNVLRLDLSNSCSEIEPPTASAFPNTPNSCAFSGTDNVQPDSAAIVSPQDIQPFPKAPPRKSIGTRKQQ